jgi:spore germination cell wall hydrolase CwlJ-like protein
MPIPAQNISQAKFTPVGSSEMQLSGADLDNVTRTIMAEAGQNATPASMAAVASVIRNRLVAGGYGKSPTEIVHAPNQFEPWNEGSGCHSRPRESALAALPTIRKVLEGVEARTIERINNAQINNVFVAADRFAEFVGQINKAIEATAHAGLKSYVRGS